MKYSWKDTFAVLLIFVASVISGVFVCSRVYEQKPYSIEPLPSEGLGMSVFVFVMIVITTAVLIFLLRRKLNKFIAVWFRFVLFVSISIAMSAFFEDYLSLFVALGMLLIYTEKDVLFRNFVNILAFAGVSAVLAMSFSLFSTIILLSIIAVYDIIAVFFTKHMVFLAKSQKDAGIFAGIMVPISKSFALVGGGDIVFPTMLCFQAFRYFGLYSSALSIVGSGLGLFVLIYLGKEKEVYPAIPTIFSGALLGLLISLL